LGIRHLRILSSFVIRLSSFHPMIQDLRLAFRSLIYRVGAFDPSTFAGVTIALALVALLASYIPALRAMRADPMIALGHG
jgi:ABC-type lipoprotein release transport system permease subunit